MPPHPDRVRRNYEEPKDKNFVALLPWWEYAGLLVLAAAFLFLILWAGAFGQR
jgi:hypothetical protein